MRFMKLSPWILARGTMEAFSSEVAFCLNEIDHTLRNLERWAKPRRVNVPPVYLPASAKIYPEPLGVVLIVSPWNYPFQLVISPLVGAIAAGNCAFIKPSSLSQNTAILLEEIIGEVFSARARFPSADILKGYEFLFWSRNSILSFILEVQELAG